MAKYTSNDIQYLAQCIKDAKTLDAKPFAFLLGAGMSYSAGIPLARDLVKKINDEPHFAVHLRGLSDPEKSSYQICMAKLTKEVRRRLLNPYLQNAKVNWASIAVAALMKDDFIARVLTFNFDSVLARACGISGHYPATYDFSVNPPAKFGFMREGAIIHLHGQGAGLVMLNSEQETRDHAEKLQPLFSNTLENHDLVVVGYSGEADHAFDKLSGNFDGSNRLFWIGHTEHPPPHVDQLMNKYPDAASYWGGADADLFLIELVQQFECWPPVLFIEPEQHLLDEIEPVIDYPSSLAGEDILKSLRVNLESQLAKKRASPVDFQILLLESKYDDIIKRAAEANELDEKRAVAWAYVMKGNALSELAKVKQDEALFRDSFGNYAAAIRIKPDMDEAFNNWGAALSFLARIKQDEALFRESISKYADAVRIDSAHHEAFNGWGNALLGLAEIKQDEALFRDSFDKYAEAVRITPDMHEAFDNWAIALMNLWHVTHEGGLLDEALAKATRAQDLSGIPDYNIACAYALKEREEDCRRQLALCRDAKSLPGREHLLGDRDLAAYRDKDWFKEFVDSLD